MSPTPQAFRDQCLFLMRTDPHRFFPVVPTRLEAVDEPLPDGPAMNGIRAEGLPGGAVATLWTNNLYEKCAATGDFSAPAVLKALTAIAQGVQTADVSVVESWERAAPLVQFRLHQPFPGAEQDPRLHFRWGDLLVFPILLLDKGLLSIVPEHREHWGVTTDELRRVGIANVRRMWGHVQPKRVGGTTPEEEVWGFATPRPVEASFTLVPEIMQKVPVPVEEMIVMVPLQGSLLVARKPNGRPRLRRLSAATAHLHSGGPLPCSPQLYHYADGKLVEYR